VRVRGYSFGYYDLLQFVTSKYPKDTSKYMASTGAAALLLNMKKRNAIKCVKNYDVLEKYHITKSIKGIK
jgi:hypothetical protein